MRQLSDEYMKLENFLDSDSNIIFALVFGSSVCGEQRKSSDIDIGIYFKSPPSGLELLSFITTLSDLAVKDVDVAVLNNASALLRHQVMKNKIELTVKDRLIYRKFREKTISDYDEYKYISGLTIYDR